MKKSFWLALVLLSAACSGGQAEPPPRPPGGGSSVSGVERVFPSLSFQQPTNLVAPPGDGRLFVTEKPGRIRVFEPQSASAALFLDITDRVGVSGTEMGLLGLAFHPRFSENRVFFVNYTAENPRRTVISRFVASEDDPDRAEASSEQVLLTFPQPYTNHNGGQLAFGPDGFLYIGTGDGGAAGDPLNAGQDLGTLLGKWLRIDVDATDGERRYAIPDGNPYKGATGNQRPEIYAHGLRNLWRFSHDAETNRWYGADVGQNAVEEVDVLRSGGNYGWRIMEGDRCYNPRTDCDRTGLVMPIATYTHDLGQSITGGYVYRGARLPSLQGAYVYGDFVSGRIWALRFDGERVTENTLLLDSDLSIATFGLGPDRELYIADFGGGIFRLK